jgi:Mg2+ and Co2+ transporter CorA
VNNREQIVRTQLEDLQSEFEAGARTIDTIADTVHEMRTALLSQQLEQAALAGTLVRRISELRKSVRQQRATLQQLRRAIRDGDRTAKPL